MALTVLAALLATMTALSETHSSFVATTTNGGNSATAGTVNLIDDDLGSALLSVTNLVPLDAITKCITVTYQGTVTPAVIKLYSSVGGTGLASYLSTTIEEGTGGSFADCSGFSPTSTLFSGTLASLASGHSDYSSGITAFTANSTPTTEVFRFTFTLLDNNLAQGLGVTPTFTWEAQNS